MNFRTARRHRHERERRQVRFWESPELATTVIAVDRSDATAVLVDIEHARADSVAQSGIESRIAHLDGRVFVPRAIRNDVLAMDMMGCGRGRVTEERGGGGR